MRRKNPQATDFHHWRIGMANVDTEGEKLLTLYTVLGNSLSLSQNYII